MIDRLVEKTIEIHGYRKFDTHIHADDSLCTFRMRPRRVVEAAAKKGLHTIVVLGHNSTKGALEAREHQDRYGIEVALGIEPRTEFGEIGVIFLSEEECELFDTMKKDKTSYKKGVYMFEAIHEAVQYLREHGSRILVGLHHPFSFSFGNKRGGFDFKKACGKDPVTWDDGVGYFNSLIELMQFFDYTELNANNLNALEGKFLLDFANIPKEYGLPGMTVVCSTDSHYIRQIGRYYSIARGNDVRECIKKGDVIMPFTPKDISYSRSRFYRTASGFVKPARKILSHLLR